MDKTYIYTVNGQRSFIYQPFNEFLEKRLNEDGTFKEKTIGIKNSEGKQICIFTDHIVKISDQE